MKQMGGAIHLILREGALAMLRLLAGVYFALAATGADAMAQDANTGNQMLPYCKAVLNSGPAG
jgi:hypothetical protein